MTLLVLLDYAAVLVFALTGALVASRAQLDIVGFFFIACLTAVGGGTLRDVLLNRDTVFWVAEPTYIAIACAAALLVFFTAHLVESRYRVLIWLDSLALAVAVPAGVGVAMGMEQPAAIVVIMGIITGCLGGLMRDVVCKGAAGPETGRALRNGRLCRGECGAGCAGTWGRHIGGAGCLRAFDMGVARRFTGLWLAFAGV